MNIKTNPSPQQKLPIGLSDFSRLRQGGFYYVDKTRFIREIIDSSAQVLLLPRPRRFGKTLNLSMLRYFFERSGEDRQSLFRGLEIENTKAFEVFGRYPVIWLTFKELKGRSWDSVFSGIAKILKEEFLRHAGLMDSKKLTPIEKTQFLDYLNGKDHGNYVNALRDLSRLLHRHHGARPVILIDEYDTPVHAGYSAGYYDDIITFMRTFLGGGLKDNEHLQKGVLTGVLRVAKESVFSDLNNLDVHTLLDFRFNSAFGFTEDEVKRLLGDQDISNHFETVSRWYDGYRFGGRVIYNPWSVLKFADGDPEKPKPYWVNTASTEMIDALATRGGEEVREEIGLLLEGKAIQKPVFESIVIRDLEKRDDLLWSFLLFSGYLKYTGEPDRHNLYCLMIPNEEVRLVYEDMVQRWFDTRTRAETITALLKALTQGSVEDFEDLLTHVVETVLSSHDTAGPEPERFYHAFVLGLLVWLEGEYEVRSNRESGLGRYDVMLTPHDRNRRGVIMEFKRVDTRRKETPEQAIEKAKTQIKTRKYAAELEAAGVKDILTLAIVFRGKEVWVEEAV